MTARCQVTGKTVGFGNHVSHSHRRTKRTYGVNLQTKRYWAPTLGRHVTLTLSARGIKTIDARGIDVVVADMIARGEKL